MKKKEIVIIPGPAGAGKSYVACALGHSACVAEYRMMYSSTSKLFSALAMAKADNSHLRFMARIKRQDVIILDDLDWSRSPGKTNTGSSIFLRTVTTQGQ